MSKVVDFSYIVGINAVDRDKIIRICGSGVTESQGPVLEYWQRWSPGAREPGQDAILMSRLPAGNKGKETMDSLDNSVSIS